MTNEDLNLSPHMARFLERYAEHGQPRGLTLRELALEELASTLRKAGAAKASLEEAMKEAERILAGLRHALSGGDAAVLSEAGISPLDPADSE